mmetsp:Transcript_22237/g.54731  ORF Transcript_22237/g.54731 Transcript_22237/m.54731 type:complete len:123 (-) Transcript_22237:1347-1715(-)
MDGWTDGWMEVCSTPHQIKERKIGRQSVRQTDMSLTVVIIQAVSLTHAFMSRTVNTRTHTHTHTQKDTQKDTQTAIIVSSPHPVCVRVCMCVCSPSVRMPPCRLTAMPPGRTSAAADAQPLL